MHIKIMWDKMKAAVNSEFNLIININYLRILKDRQDRNTVWNYFKGNLSGALFFELIVEAETFDLWGGTKDGLLWVFGHVELGQEGSAQYTLLTQWRIEVLSFSLNSPIIFDAFIVLILFYNNIIILILRLI